LSFGFATLLLQLNDLAVKDSPLTPGKRRKLRRRRRRRKCRKKNMLLDPPSIPKADRPDQTPVPEPRDRPRRPKLVRPPAHGASTRSERNAIKSKCSRPLEKEPSPHFPELRKFRHMNLFIFLRLNCFFTFLFYLGQDPEFCHFSR
jgi:hypothetical protein